MAAPRTGAVRPPVIAREERRRRWLLLGIAAALLLGISPIVGHHVVGAIPWFSAAQQHLGAICLVALHLMLAPVHGGAHLLLYAGIAYLAVERGRAFLRHATLMGRLDTHAVAADSALGVAARRAGLAVHRLRLVHGLTVPAFTTGWWRPTVIVAADLSARLDADELSAVLAHERVHVERRDPLRLFALRALASLLFWLPALRRLAADLEDEVEITADDEAARDFALPLASAVLKLATPTTAVPTGTVGFQRADLLPRRIRRLAGEDTHPTSHVSTRSLVGAFAALALVWTSGVIVLHPLGPSGDDHTAAPLHCEHDAHPVTHLFCRGWTWRDDAAPCPHETPLSTARHSTH